MMTGTPLTHNFFSEIDTDLMPILQASTSDAGTNLRLEVFPVAVEVIVLTTSVYK
jgi:hypothetical protein